MYMNTHDLYTNTQRHIHTWPQIAYADRILLNKIDLSTPSELDAIEQRLRTINAVAPVYRTHSSNIDLGLILGVQAFEASRAQEVEKLVNGEPKDVCDECGLEVRTHGCVCTW